MASVGFEDQLKKGSAELLILALLEDGPAHGYALGKRIERESGGVLEFHVASLYPLLYRLEERSWIHGRWREKAGTRRRRYYELTGEGREALARHRRSWRRFAEAVEALVGGDAIPEAGR